MKLEDQLCFALFAASEAIMRAYRPLFEPNNLTFPQYLLMIVLWQHGAQSTKQIAKTLRISPATVIALADQLEAAGYILYARSASNPPLVTILLTQTGVQLEHAAMDAQHQVHCNSGLTDQGLVTLRSELHELVDRLTDPATAPKL